MHPFELDALKNHPKEGPVYMVNLVKYREKSLDGNGSGRDAYNRYAAVVSPLLENLGRIGNSKPLLGSDKRHYVK